MNVAALDPFLELERTGANRVGVCRVVGEVSTFVDVLGHDRHGAVFKGVDERTKRFLELEDNRHRIRGGDAFDIGQRCTQTRVGFTQENIGRKHNVFCGERFAVMPFDTFVKLEGVGQTIFGDFPAFGQARHRVQIAVIAQKAFIDITRDKLGRAVLNETKHQSRRFGLNNDVKTTASFLGGQRRRQGSSD